MPLPARLWMVLVVGPCVEHGVVREQLNVARPQAHVEMEVRRIRDLVVEVEDRAIGVREERLARIAACRAEVVGVVESPKPAFIKLARRHRKELQAPLPFGVHHEWQTHWRRLLDGSKCQPG